MIDYLAIGKRIKEQRKNIRKISQDKMATDLFMYQADISNMEKGKTGSGIDNLTKLDDIASYFDIPLQRLIFGEDGRIMEKYYGKKMELKLSKKRISKVHEKIICKLMGGDDFFEQQKPFVYECGSYTIYNCLESQMISGENTEYTEKGMVNPDFAMLRIHTYIIYGNEVVGAMVSAVTYAMEHVYRPSFVKLQKMIQANVLDVTDFYRTINPYWAMFMFDEENKEYWKDKMSIRMDEIRELGENKIILYVESVYVREDCRQKGICRMYFDCMRLMCEDPILWVNMEPTEGRNLDDEYEMMTSYTQAELGQLNLNAYIAERLGFAIDPEVWHREAEVIDEEGNITSKIIEARKTAYYFPKEYRKLVENDGDLTAQGRALQKVAQSDSEDRVEIDTYHTKFENKELIQNKLSVVSGPNTGKISYVYALKDLDSKTFEYGVLKEDYQRCGLNEDNHLEHYFNFYDIAHSEYIRDLVFVDDMLRTMTGDPKEYDVKSEPHDSFIFIKHYNIDDSIRGICDDRFDIMDCSMTSMNEFGYDSKIYSYGFKFKDKKTYSILYALMVKGNEGIGFYVSKKNHFRLMDTEEDFEKWFNSLIERYEPSDRMNRNSKFVSLYDALKELSEQNIDFEELKNKYRN